MHGRAAQSTKRPAGRSVTSDLAAPVPAQLPDPGGPAGAGYLYHLSPEAEGLLADAQARRRDNDGEAPLYRPAARLADVADAVTEEARRQHRNRLAREARRRGRRLGTISARSWDGKPRPYLRLSGHWLREAGFDLGRHFEVEVSNGRLKIEVV